MVPASLIQSRNIMMYVPLPISPGDSMISSRIGASVSRPQGARDFQMFHVNHQIHSTASSCTQYTPRRVFPHFLLGTEYAPRSTSDPRERESLLEVFRPVRLLSPSTQSSPVYIQSNPIQSHPIPHCPIVSDEGPPIEVECAPFPPSLAANVQWYLNMVLKLVG